MSSNPTPQLHDVIDKAEAEAFADQLGNILSADKELRSNAEKALDQMAGGNLKGLALGLVFCFRYHQNVTVG